MTRVASPTLFGLVESFFRDHLLRTRGCSAHTVRAYRDALRLLFGFIADRGSRGVADLTLDDLNVEAILGFLTHLEAKRANTVGSRNCRLAAIHSFFKHLIQHDLSRAGQYQRVLAVPAKRARLNAAQYLEPEDVRAILDQPDQASALGRRDHALLLFLYNTGARVSEALNVRLEDLSVVPPLQARLHGKGNKDRLCPLWRETAAALKQLPAVRAGQLHDPIFCNRKGEVLSRDGVAYMLRKYTAQAARTFPSLRRRRVTPHQIRHSCAVALLQAGVDVTVIRDYLGHASIATTSRYVSTNLQMKRDALEVFWQRSGLVHERERAWKPKPDLLAFLASI
jgi:site-specific recombinase XerD